MIIFIGNKVLEFIAPKQEEAINIFGWITVEKKWHRHGIVSTETRPSVKKGLGRYMYMYIKYLMYIIVHTCIHTCITYIHVCIWYVHVNRKYSIINVYMCTCVCIVCYSRDINRSDVVVYWWQVYFIYHGIVFINAYIYDTYNCSHNIQ